MSYDGNVTIGASLKGRLVQNGLSISGSISIPSSYDEYEGSYEITSSANDQTILTADKHLSNNITINAMPKSDVSNEYGGVTFNIGG